MVETIIRSPGARLVIHVIQYMVNVPRGVSSISWGKCKMKIQIVSKSTIPIYVDIDMENYRFIWV
jgi:hypothetical protein